MHIQIGINDFFLNFWWCSWRIKYLMLNPNSYYMTGNLQQGHHIQKIYEELYSIFNFPDEVLYCSEMVRVLSRLE